MPALLNVENALSERPPRSTDNSEMVIEVVRIYVSLHALVEGKRHGELHLPFWAGFRAPPDKAFQRSNIQFGVAGALENPDPGNLPSHVEI